MTEKLAQIREKMMSKMKVLKFILVLFNPFSFGHSRTIVNP
jgi:hypothetical protein